MEFILDLIGTYLIYWCIYFKRNEESEIKLLSKDWWIILVIIIATVLLQIEI
jgi:hypothetical protein